MSSLRLLRPALRARGPFSLALAPIAAPRYARTYATDDKVGPKTPPELKMPVEGDNVRASNRAKNESAVGVSSLSITQMSFSMLTTAIHVEGGRCLRSCRYRALLLLYEREGQGA